MSETRETKGIVRKLHDIGEKEFDFKGKTKKRYFAKIEIESADLKETIEIYLNAFDKNEIQRQHDLIEEGNPATIQEEKNGKYWNVIHIETEKGGWEKSQPKEQSMNIKPLISMINKIDAQVTQVMIIVESFQGWQKDILQQLDEIKQELKIGRK